MLARGRAPRPFYSRTTKLVKCLEGAAVLPTDRDPVRGCLPRAAQALLKFWQAASQSGAAQEHYGAVRRSPTHPSVDIARPGRAAGPRAPRATG